MIDIFCGYLIKIVYQYHLIILKLIFFFYYKLPKLKYILNQD